jgi:Fe-S-cluster containining protein
LRKRANVLHETPCIFLESGKCSVYNARPFVCRALHSLDGSKCKEAVMSKKRLVEFTGYNHRYYVFRTAKAALSQYFEQIGCLTKELTIARAMKQYFESPDSAEAWLRGDEV